MPGVGRYGFLRYKTHAMESFDRDGHALAPQLQPQTPREVKLSASLLLWGVLFGSVGFGFFLYGKKQKAIVPLVCGLALMVFPYFISNTVVLVLVGIAFAVAPYFVRI